MVFPAGSFSAKSCLVIKLFAGTGLLLTKAMGSGNFKKAVVLDGVSLPLYSQTSPQAKIIKIKAADNRIISNVFLASFFI
jgi:hypothetical protein